MYKILFFLLFTTTVFNAQNKELIKQTFYNQSVNELDKTALEEGFKGNETVCIKVFFRTNSNGEIIDTEIPEQSQIFESEMNSIIAQIPQLDPNEYIRKGEVMKYGVKLCFKLASSKERKKILQDGKRIAIKIKWFYVKEYFPIKIIDLEDAQKMDFSSIHKIPVTQTCKNITEEGEIRQCVVNEITSHVNRNFDAGLVSELGLSEGRHRVVVTFFIAKNGEIVNISATGTEELIEEGIRVINSFPDFYKGGEIDGAPVDVKYTLPITMYGG